MITEELREGLDRAVSKFLKERNAHPDTIPEYTVEIPPPGINADYAANVAMVLAKHMKMNPVEVADEIIKRIDLSRDTVKNRWVHNGLNTFPRDSPLSTAASR